MFGIGELENVKKMWRNEEERYNSHGLELIKMSFLNSVLGFFFFLLKISFSCSTHSYLLAFDIIKKRNKRIVDPT